MTNQLTLPKEYISDKKDNENRFSHYALKDKITQALVEGIPIQAICGKMFVPHRDPNKYPMCKICHEIYQHLPE